ncbi:MAG: hypothetical protein MUC34_15110 [Anaerolineae bacterium]|jgi:hypothetical protein|nr:hypothetical protein [Anaerolineae bacterium]
MTPWLTFVIGIIAGLVIGWLIDMLYRRVARGEAVEAVDRAPEPAQPLPAAAPELPGVAAASAVAVAAVSDEALDVPPLAETAEVAQEVNWQEISEGVAEASDEALDVPSHTGTAAPSVAVQMPDEAGMPPSAAEALKPAQEDETEPRG